MDYPKTYMEAVEMLQERRGMSKLDALPEAARRFPALHQQFIEEANGLADPEFQSTKAQSERDTPQGPQTLQEAQKLFEAQGGMNPTAALLRARQAYPNISKTSTERHPPNERR